MIPILVDFGFFRIPTFGIFLVLALFWSSYLLWKLTLLTSYKEVDVFDSLSCGLGIGLFLGRLVHVVTHFSDFGFNIVRFILINGYPGVHLAGALIGFFIGFSLCAKSRKIACDKFFDYIIPPLFVALGIGKLGAFFSGSDIGTKTHFFLALRYPNIDGFRHIPAIYAAILYLFLAFISYQVLMNVRKGLYRHTALVGFAVIAVSIISVLTGFITDFQTTTYGVSIDYWIYLTCLLTGCIYLVYHFRTNLFSKFGRHT